MPFFQNKKFFLKNLSFHPDPGKSKKRREWEKEGFTEINVLLNSQTNFYPTLAGAFSIVLIDSSFSFFN